jgi:hypothetical protein
VVLTIHTLFEVIGFRKLYCQMAESTRRALGPAMERWLTLEATFERHELAGEQYEDWHIFSVLRREWDPKLVALVTGNRVRGA